MRQSEFALGKLDEGVGCDERADILIVNYLAHCRKRPSHDHHSGSRMFDDRVEDAERAERTERNKRHHKQHLTAAGALIEPIKCDEGALASFPPQDVKPSVKPSSAAFGSDRLQVLGKLGGARRDRTADLVNAIHALSQLSYGPFRS